LRFGTDGVRGVANAQLTPEFALALGRASARVLGAGRWGIGADTRRSGPLLAAAVAAGLAAEGAEVEDFGVLPTPGTAFWSQTTDCPAVMVSASHNPFADNGLKLFAPGGLKLSDAVQAELEAAIDDVRRDVGDAVPTGAQIGTVRSGDATSAYVEHLLATTEGRSLSGLRVVLDCANGAASRVGPTVFERLGATVIARFDDPDGVNINEGCGSTHPEHLQRVVVEQGADVGFAFDGDADRMLAVDAGGRLVDGDQLMAIAALDLRERGRLAHDTVVVTVMTNLGFRLGMEAAGVRVVETQVGDRYVLEAMEAGGFVLGGEQSGHVIHRDAATTGDGVLSAVRTADLLCRSGRGLAELADAAMVRLPQVLRNVRIDAPMPDVADRLAEPIAEARAQLGERGRVLIRPSGTEPLVRVMVEADDEDRAAAVAGRLVDAVTALG